MFVDQSIQNYQRRQADFIIAEIVHEARTAIRTATEMVTERRSRTSDSMIRHHLLETAREVSGIAIASEQRIRLDDDSQPCLVRTLEREVAGLSRTAADRVRLITDQLDFTPTPTAEIAFGMFLGALLRAVLQCAPDNAKITLGLAHEGQTVFLDLIGTGRYSELELLAHTEHPARTQTLIAALGGHFRPAPNGVSFRMPLAALTNSPWPGMEATSLG